MLSTRRRGTIQTRTRPNATNQIVQLSKSEVAQCEELRSKIGRLLDLIPVPKQDDPLTTSFKDLGESMDEYGKIILQLNVLKSESVRVTLEELCNIVEQIATRSQPFLKKEGKGGATLDVKKQYSSSLNSLKRISSSLESIIEKIKGLERRLFDADYKFKPHNIGSSIIPLDDERTSECERNYKDIKNKSKSYALAVAELEGELGRLQSQIESLEQEKQRLQSDKILCRDQLAKAKQEQARNIENRRQQSARDVENKFTRNASNLYRDMENLTDAKNKQVEQLREIISKLELELANCPSVSRGGILHILLVLDKSGSMQGDAWNLLMLSYSSLICELLQPKFNNTTVSTIFFDSQTHPWYTKISPKDAPRDIPSGPTPQNAGIWNSLKALFMPGGATSFSHPVRYIRQFLADTPVEDSVFTLFLTDGRASTSDSESILTSIHRQHPKFRMSCFCMGDSDVEQMRLLATAANGTDVIQCPSVTENGINRTQRDQILSYVVKKSEVLASGPLVFTKMVGDVVAVSNIIEERIKVVQSVIERVITRYENDIQEIQTSGSNRMQVLSRIEREELENHNGVWDAVDEQCLKQSEKAEHRYKITKELEDEVVASILDLNKKLKEVEVRLRFAKQSLDDSEAEAKSISENLEGLKKEAEERIKDLHINGLSNSRAEELKDLLQYVNSKKILLFQDLDFLREFLISRLNSIKQQEEDIMNLSLSTSVGYSNVEQLYFEKLENYGQLKNTLGIILDSSWWEIDSEVAKLLIRWFEVDDEDKLESLNLLKEVGFAVAFDQEKDNDVVVKKVLNLVAERLRRSHEVDELNYENLRRKLNECEEEFDNYVMLQDPEGESCLVEDIKRTQRTLENKEKELEEINSKLSDASGKKLSRLEDDQSQTQESINKAKKKLEEKQEELQSFRKFKAIHRLNPEQIQEILNGMKTRRDEIKDQLEEYKHRSKIQQAENNKKLKNTEHLLNRIRGTIYQQLEIIRYLTLQADVIQMIRASIVGNIDPIRDFYGMAKFSCNWANSGNVDKALAKVALVLKMNPGETYSDSDEISFG